jgi:hypothetical protein
MVFHRSCFLFAKQLSSGRNILFLLPLVRDQGWVDTFDLCEFFCIYMERFYLWAGFNLICCTNLTVNWRLSCKPSQSCSEKMLVLQFISRRLSHLQIFALPFLLFLGCRKQIYIICIRSKVKQELNSS